MMIHAQITKASWEYSSASHANDCPALGAMLGNDGLWWIDFETAEDVFDLAPCIVWARKENKPYELMIYDDYIE